MKEEYSVIESLKLTSSYSSVADIERLIDKVCTSVGVKEDAYGNVLIAVTEAVNNAIQHGNKENETLSIDVSVKDVVSVDVSIEDVISVESVAGISFGVVADDS